MSIRKKVQHHIRPINMKNVFKNEFPIRVVSEQVPTARCIKRLYTEVFLYNGIYYANENNACPCGGQSLPVSRADGIGFIEPSSTGLCTALGKQNALAESSSAFAANGCDCSDQFLFGLNHID
jgi:hypothetical protein